MFKPTHKVVTEANKSRTNSVVHCYKRGTLVEVLDTVNTYAKVVNEQGSVQFVPFADLKAI